MIKLSENEVVVTGMGAVTPVGNNVPDFIDKLYRGKTGFATISRFDPAQLPTRFAGEVQGLKEQYRDVKISFALAAVAEAMNQAYPNQPLDPNCRTGLSIGIGLELFSMEHLVELKTKGLPTFTSNQQSLTYLNTPSDLCVNLIGEQYALNQPPQIHISACAASTDAIGTAYEMIARGLWDVAIAGGVDSMINPMGVAGFCRIGALSSENNNPEKASRPFDISREGFVLGEGAGFIVLEAKHYAEQRGAQNIAKISGYGNSLDAYSVSDPHPDGDGALLAMQRALTSAQLMPENISAISAHGTGTAKNDPAESKAIKRLLNGHVAKVPVFASKSMIGHLISAGGAVEIIAAIACIQNQKIHHTANLEEIDPDCSELYHVLEQPLKFNIKHILKNSFGFGGQNACLIISDKDI